VQFTKLHLLIFDTCSAPDSHGSGTFRSLVFSLFGAKVPTGNIHSLERKFPGIFAPGSESSPGTFQGANVPGNIRSTERFTRERTVQVTHNVSANAKANILKMVFYSLEFESTGYCSK